MTTETKRWVVPLERDLAATVALAAFSVATMIGFVRVFSGWEFAADTALIVGVVHLTSFVFRRAGVPGMLAVPLTVITSALLTLSVYYSATMQLIVPTGDTVGLVRRDVELVLDQFPTAVAPVLYGGGWAFAAGIAAFVAANLADVFAFRAMGRAEALVPGGVVFVFVAALGSPRLRLEVTMGLIATGIVAIAALRWYHDRAPTNRPSGQRSVSFAAPAALVTAAVIAGLAGLLGPEVPGAGAEPLIETKGRAGSITTITSPLVDIRSRLTNRGNVELFKVNADREAYWRTTTLAEFDGESFQLPARSLEQLDDRSVTSASSILNRQQLQVLALSGQTIPAAADPIQAGGIDTDGTDLSLRINRDTSTLLSPTELVAGQVFTVVSASDPLSPDVLRGTEAADSGDDVFTELPGDLPGVVADTAERITAGATTDYDRALALQNWFRNEFDYSLEVQSGHGNTAIESFLEQRVGYCEQFSATFAAMTRTLGMPSRVAVGYTSGIVGDDGWYSVRGKNAHAWPEVYFDDVGWVAFEPTPGRGAPGAEDYTGVPAQQDTSGPSEVPDERSVPDTTPSLTTPGTIAPIPDPAGDVPPKEVPSRGTEAAAAAADDGSFPWALLFVLALLTVAIGGPWWWRKLRRTREGHLPTDRRVAAAWARGRRAAARVGVQGADTMTTTEWAQQIGNRLPVAARPAEALAEAMNVVTFSGRDADELIVDDPSGWADQVESTATGSMTPGQRLQAYFSLR